jgi:uncharacterized membrane protein
METILMQWLDMSIRWFHVIAGIAWIGSSFYFVALDLGLKPRDSLPEGASGEAWQVHGGGFYHLVKYMVAPAAMPDQLTWFKWEAYATWLSGMALMVVVYYMAAELYLIDPSVSELSTLAAVTLSLAGLGAGWLIYELLCRSALGRNQTALTLTGFLFLAALAYGFTLVFSGRGASMQMGALIGTMMVANVFLVIIPSQRKVVAALLAGEEPDPALGAVAKQRSLHNNYLTLPVIFLMIANHYPLTFAGPWSWLILTIVLVMGAVIRHFFNQRHKGEASPWWCWAAAAAGLAAMVWLSARPAVMVSEAEADMDMAEVESIIASRCAMCHAAEPLWPGMASPPKDVVLETQAQIRLRAEAIGLQAVHTRAMPPGNITDIPDEERRRLAAWIAAGAPGWEE